MEVKANKQIVVGFSVDTYDRSTIERLTDREKHEYTLEDIDETMSYDNVKAWFNDLNDDLIDTENYFWYVITID